MMNDLQPFVVTGTKRNGRKWERVINASAPEGARMEAERRGVTVAKVITVADHEAAQAARQAEEYAAEEAERRRRDAALTEALAQRRAEAEQRRASAASLARRPPTGNPTRVVVIEATPGSMFWAIFWPVLAVWVLMMFVTFVFWMAWWDHVSSKVSKDQAVFEQRIRQLSR